MRKVDKEEGWFEVEDNPISKAGVFQYLGSNISPDLIPDKLYNVYRPAEELAKAETIESFKLKPWIITHKMLGDAFDPEDDTEIEGFIGEKIYFKDGILYANIKAVSKRLRDFIKSGVKELSCGYQCKWNIEQGVTSGGEAYDVVQTDIIGNHLALVDSGRMGPDVAVMDRNVNYFNFAFDSKKGKDMNDLGDRVAGDDDDMETRIGVLEDMGKTTRDQLDKISDMLSKLTKDYDKDVEVVEDEQAEDDDNEVKASEDDDNEVEIIEDSETEKSKSKDGYSMDSMFKKIKTLENRINNQAVLSKQKQEKEELYNQASYHVGAFDHSDMTLERMSEYIVGKLGIPGVENKNCGVVNGYLSATNAPHLSTKSHATDSNSEGLMDKILGRGK